jgi:hypothetical protein
MYSLNSIKQLKKHAYYQDELNILIYYIYVLINEILRNIDEIKCIFLFPYFDLHEINTSLVVILYVL